MSSDQSLKLDVEIFGQVHRSILHPVTKEQGKRKRSVNSSGREFLTSLQMAASVDSLDQGLTAETWVQLPGWCFWKPILYWLATPLDGAL